MLYLGPYVLLVNRRRAVVQHPKLGKVEVNTGETTVAVYLTKDLEEVDFNRDQLLKEKMPVAYGNSKTHPKDHFNKRIGLVKAAKKAFSKIGWGFEWDPIGHVYYVFDAESVLGDSGKDSVNTTDFNRLLERLPDLDHIPHTHREKYVAADYEVNTTIAKEVEEWVVRKMEQLQIAS